MVEISVGYDPCCVIRTQLYNIYGYAMSAWMAWLCLLHPRVATGSLSPRMPGIIASI